MEKLFKYTGNLSSYSTEKLRTGITHMDMIVKDLYDSDKAPARLQAYGELAEYLEDISGTDDEEKYLQKDFWFDDLLNLRYVVIQAVEETDIDFINVPAKIIASTPGLNSTTIITFGPAEHITDDKPKQMSRDEYFRFLDWARENKLYRYRLPF